MKLSIVTTLYKSSQFVEEFYSRVKEVVSEITNDYEIIFVNDGSPDNSLDIVVRLFENDSRIVVVDLSRNFGHHKAIMAGLRFAQGDYIFLIDIDLEEEPELLTEFWCAGKNENDIDVVYGVQVARKGNFFEQLSGKVFYFLFNKLSSYSIPENLLTARLMKKRYVDALLEHQEREVFLAGLFTITGFNQLSIKVVKHGSSSSSYTLRLRISLFVNAITSFSDIPLKLIFINGLFITCCSLFYVVYLICKAVFYGVTVPGWTSVIASVWLLGGVILFSVGVVAVYISKIFIETKRRPSVLVKSIFDERNR